MQGHLVGLSLSSKAFSQNLAGEEQGHMPLWRTVRSGEDHTRCRGQQGMPPSGQQVGDPEGPEGGHLTWTPTKPAEG